MNNELVEKAVDMGRRVGYALVVTCDGNGLPHIAASRRVEKIMDFSHAPHSDEEAP